MSQDSGSSYWHIGIAVESLIHPVVGTPAGG
jgi:hypothetical protein